MHAIIRQGEGKYYVSAVFGYYKDITATDDYEKYLQNIYNAYYVVWDAEGKRLARCLAMVPDTKYILPDLPTIAAPNRLWREPSQIYIIPQVIIIDANQGNWRKDEEGVGCVDFLNRDLLDSFLDRDEQPKEILDKCRAMDAGYVYEETTEIKTEADIVNLSWASGGFHDAFIAKGELMGDGTLYLLFDGTWGCKIEVWFWGDLEYDTSSMNSDEYDHFWLGSTVILQDGFVYLINDDDMTVDKIAPGYCYFKARHMKYRIIPD